VITSLREFDAIAPAWKEITGAAGQASPFLSHEWFACCWRTAGPNRRRELWMLEDAAGPLALLPLARWRSRVSGLPVRVIGFLDAPDAPFVDVPAARATDDWIRTFLDHARSQHDWDVISLRKLPAESGTLRALEASLADGFSWRRGESQHAPYVRVAGSWEDLVERKEQLEEARTRIEGQLRDHGPVSVEEHGEVDPAGPLFAELVELSRQSWATRNGAPQRGVQGMPRFFRELTLRASARGWLRVWILRLAGRAVAAEYQLGDEERLHALRSDCDGGLAGGLSAAALKGRIIGSLFERRAVREYHLGPGPGPYDLPVVTGTRETVALDVYAPTAYGALVGWVDSQTRTLLGRWRGLETA
jgi:CelD/BcsL family acetyltransferase involved in cellulose biosynthesis